MALSRRSVRLSLPEAAIPRPSFNCFSASASQSDGSWTTGGVSFADLDKLHVLGSGNGGTVYKVRHRITSDIYAMKMVHDDPTVNRQLRREIEILRHCTDDCPNVVRCHGVFQKPSSDVAILMEFMDSGSLESLRGKVSEPQLTVIARQILRGLCYLRSKKVLHRDIKPANLLINSENVVKIADFGVSKIMVPSLDACNTFVGTCAYMSPEKFDSERFLDTNSEDYDVYSGDIWSFGLTMLELYVGHFPLLEPGQRSDWPTIMCAVCFADPPHAPDQASEAFRSFIDCCLQKDWRQRWTATRLLSHPFVQQDPLSDS